MNSELPRPDTLVRDLAEQLRPEYVVFLTNVPGVFDRPPEEQGARLLRRIVVRPGGGWRVAEVEGGGLGGGGSGGGESGVRMSVDAHDATGGIALKVEEAAAVARLGIPVVIAQAGSEDGDAACRLGPQVALQAAGTAAAAAAAGAAGGGWRGTLVVLE
ncbi:hypothetical protein HYH02_010665 [Chlamydomonas schloesseri]|uniref:Aspartate/glutamate/uridylate kinase domain-containing protein n=1 Tax=Chlamydomonas schloesseri TaxID=2026947 RepID=A0A835W361_9CHLO|nr:hypothetical protein HYH02_010665 [Chlamydomonas schloesseri]|eukprot:KAG2438867.1 hypothetical protein HYH02_010665 [Chlamydomonas schloesseri]